MHTHVAAMILASIPSPSNNQLELFGLRITFYGLFIGIGIAAAVVVATRRYRNYGGDPRVVERIALWAVIAGLIGARAGWVVTHTGQLDNIIDVFAIWQGGLAFYGAILFGGVTAILLAWRMRTPIPMFADAAAVGIPLAQAIGRWGNYANQELYGYPTSLPWGLEIDPLHRVAGYEAFETFHPTFLYESLWNLAIVAALILVDRMRVLKRGNLILLYLMLVSFGRFFWEQLRLDTTFRVFGVSRNGWISVGVFVAAGIWLFIRQRNAALETWEGVTPWVDDDLRNDDAKNKRDRSDPGGNSNKDGPETATSVAGEDAGNEADATSAKRS